MRRAAPKLIRYYTHAQKFESKDNGIYTQSSGPLWRETCITPASNGKTGMVGYIKTGININQNFQIIARKLHKKMMNCSVRNDNAVETIIFFYRDKQ